MDQTGLEEYKQAVEEQTRALLDVVRSVAHGDLDQQVSVPSEGEGIEALSELAIGLKMMVDDLRAMIAEQQQARGELQKDQQQLEVALQELKTVHQRYLRERWEDYPSGTKGSKGYYRFGEEEGPTEDAWLPAMTSAVHQAETVVQRGIADAAQSHEAEATLAIPVQLYDELIGVLGFSREEANSWAEEEIAAAKAIADEVAEALDRQRLFEETQQALIETERMYEASAELAEAQNYEEVLSVLRARTLLGRADHSASLSLFDRTWVGNDIPEWVVPVAQWSSAPSAEGPRYGLKDLPSASDLLQPDTPTIVTDVGVDPRMDDNARDLYIEHYGVRSAIAVPLNVRGQWIGYVDALFTRNTDFSEAEIRRLMVLAGQAAIVVQNLRQLEEARARAQRERILREVTTRMRSSTDPDTLARTAVRELGTALGRSVFIRLGGARELSASPARGGQGERETTGVGEGGTEVGAARERHPRRLRHPAITDPEGPPAEGGE